MIRFTLFGLVLIAAPFLPQCLSSITRFEGIKSGINNITIDSHNSVFSEVEQENHSEELVEYLLSTLDSSEPNEPESIQRKAFVVSLIKKPHFKCVAQALFKRIPELPKIFRGVWKFLSSKDAFALREALKQFLPPFLADAGQTVDKINKVLVDDKDIFMWQALRLWIFLQKPEVLQVIDKFQALDEVLKFSELGKRCNFNVLHALQDLEANLLNPLYI
ncbi:unnamed protein product [Allacma fusca]|uniref:Uncharacterized protein n=1 Tax=Allacma fusca TaxID=39272 RepID=A0A8J2JMV4_9HEXA|nr:unnamed protein product [Allacma fusca]